MITEPTPALLRDLAEAFDDPTETVGFAVRVGGQVFSPGYLLRRIADEHEYALHEAEDDED